MPRGTPGSCPPWRAPCRHMGTHRFENSAQQRSPCRGSQGSILFSCSPLPDAVLPTPPAPTPGSLYIYYPSAARPIQAWLLISRSEHNHAHSSSPAGVAVEEAEAHAGVALHAVEEVHAQALATPAAAAAAAAAGEALKDSAFAQAKQRMRQLSVIATNTISAPFQTARQQTMHALTQVPRACQHDRHVWPTHHNTLQCHLLHPQPA
jgi:hypothetical protein